VDAARARRALAVGRPVTLTWDNGEGLEFRRTIAVDDKYMFTVRPTGQNNRGHR
jgi:YidC/Oxa1 family membrane protein insertase